MNTEEMQDAYGKPLGDFSPKEIRKAKSDGNLTEKQIQNEFGSIWKNIPKISTIKIPPVPVNTRPNVVINIVNTLKNMSVRTHATAMERGFYGEPVIMDKVAGKLALVHSEVTEVLEALRKDQGADKVTEEVVDILIRTLSLHEWLTELGLATDDLDERMQMVMDRNDARPVMHGHKWG